MGGGGDGAGGGSSELGQGFGELDAAVGGRERKLDQDESL
jgi:hypothetical protein